MFSIFSWTVRLKSLDKWKMVFGSGGHMGEGLDMELKFFYKNKYTN